MAHTEPANGTVSRLGSGKIIRGHDADKIFEGEAVLKAAREDAERIREQAKVDFEKEVQRGFDEGRASGEETSTQLLTDTVLRCEHYLDSREEELVDLVMMATRGILDTFENRELSKQMLKKAIVERRNTRGMTFYVHPSEKDDLIAAVDQIGQEIGQIDNVIEILADASLEPRTCVLDTPVGYVQLGVEAQLEALRTGLLAVFGDLVNEDSDA